jgi:glyoxylase-like metal-dependent hydrolase (beta-lactamase superfamily II)
MTESVKVAVIPVTPFQQNCSLVWCVETNKAAFIDPGGEVDRLIAAANEQGVELEKILLTHGHLDHAGGTAELAERTGVPVEGPHKEDQFLLESLDKQGSRYGFEGARTVTPDRWLEDGDTVSVGNQQFAVIHCPGHTPGHVVFYHAGVKLAVVGDVLFHGSIGRTDLPRGDHMALINAIRGKLWPLGDDVSFLPGHGGMSTFGNERKTNPYVSDFVEY